MIRLALAALLAALGVAGWKAAERDCSPVDISRYAHVDYHGPSNAWWDTETGRLIGYSAAEDDPVTPAGCWS